LQAQNIASPKWLPTTYAPGLSKTAAYAAYRMDRFNYKYGRPSYFLLASFPTAARQSATQLSHTTFSQLSEPTQGESRELKIEVYFDVIDDLQASFSIIGSSMMV
jgi:hypothetical protein